MSATGYQVKVYHVENKITKEIRKFAIEQDVAANYEYLSAKIRSVFPSLLRKDIEIFWRDNEEDFLTISSNEELICAWEEHEEKSATLKLFVKEKQEKKSGSSPRAQEEVEHPGVICDGCDSKLKGIRYKCTKCDDFDLCSKCETKDNHPSDHELLCIKHPRMRSEARGWYPGFSPRHFRRGHGPQMFCRRPPFGRFGFFCDPNQQRKRCGEESKSQAPNAKKSCPRNTPPVDEKALGESVGQFAACFGLDPEVAKCYFVSFTDDLKEMEKKDAEEKTKENPKAANTDKDQEEEKKQGDLATLLATAFGVQQELVNHLLDPFVPKENAKNENDESTPENKSQQQQQQQQQKENDPEMETGEVDDEDLSHRQEEDSENNVDFEVNEDDDDKKDEVNEDDKKEEEKETKEEPKKEDSATNNRDENSSQFKDELENMMRNFSEQIGLPPNDGNNIHEGLQSLLQGMFNFQQQPNQQKQTDQEKEGEPRKPEDFVFVDDSKTSNSLTKEESFYQNKLKESLAKMLTMGFDNDGGWLEQLLVSKDLSIDRVLEALNPSVEED